MAARYRPTNAAAVPGHIEQLDLLANDMADAPAEPLKRAIEDWVRSSRWMPKASDLWDRIQRGPAQSGTPRRAEFLNRMREQGNRNLDAEGRTDIRWIEENGSLRLIDTAEIIAREKRLRDPANAADIARMRAA